MSRPGTPQAHPLTYGRMWSDPATGVLIPKAEESNLSYRRQILDMCAVEPETRRSVLALCRKSFLYWANTFAWTYQQLDIDDQGNQTAMFGEATNAPWITWPVHDALHAAIRGAIEKGQDLIIPKSRDMRVTWHVLLEFTHLWLFNPKATFLLVSEIEDKVYKRGDPDALFSRLQYVLDRLPWWMQPGFDLVDKHLGNSSNGASIDGTATTASVGVGGRRTCICFDEAARNKELGAAWDATKDVSPTRIATSTPYGPGRFRDLCYSGLPQFVVGYWDHPLKGRGRELREDKDGRYTGKPGAMFWWTPWFEKQVEGGRSRRDVSQNLLIDHDTSGNSVFDSDVLTRCIARAQQNPPRFIGDLKHQYSGERRDVHLRQKKLDGISFVEAERGRMKVWCELVEDDQGNWRPDQTRQYALFSDISNGLSSSNSVVKVGDIDTGEVIIEVADPTEDPADWARLLVMLGVWVGGVKKRALIGWEANGPGLTVRKHMKSLQYDYLWKPEGEDEPGFVTNRTSKVQIIEDLRDGYARDKIIDYSLEGLREAGDYVYALGKGPVPSRLLEDKDARETHGDRVIATAGLWLMIRDHARIPAPTEDPPPPGTIGSRMQKFAKAQARKKKRAGAGW